MNINSKMKTKNCRSVFLRAFIVTLIGFAGANAVAELETDFSVSAGFESDDNLRVEELDNNSGQADSAFLISGDAELEFKPLADLTLRLGYGLRDKTYQTFSTYDQQISTLKTDLAYEISGFNLGMLYIHADASLASRQFMDLQQVSVYGGKLFDNGIYTRISRSSREKRFQSYSDRDAVSNEWDARLFYFPGQAKTYWNLSIAQEKEDAQTRQFDNHALNLSARYSTPADWFNRTNTILFSLQYLRRAYQANPDEQPFSRKDKKQIASIAWTIYFNPTWSAQSAVENTHNNSNLESAAYSENSLRFNIQAKF